MARRAPRHATARHAPARKAPLRRAGGGHGRKGSNALALAVIGVVVVLAVLLVAGAASGVRSLLAGKRPAPKKAAASAGAGAKKAALSTSATAMPAGGRRPVSAPATDQVVPVLMYHHIMPEPDNFIAISPAEFDQQMKWLRDRGYHAVTLAQFVDFVREGRRLPEKPVLITFDDGRSNQLTYGVPILEKYGFTATFFVCKKWVESPSDSFMHADDLGALLARGYDVESHTNSHTFLVRSKSEDYGLMKARLWGETYGMKEWLGRVTRRPVTALALPGGAHDKLTAQLTGEAGYSVAFTTNTGLVRYKGQDPQLLPRYNAGARGLRFSSFQSIFTKAEAASGPATASAAVQ